MDVITVYTPGHWDTYDSYGLIACQLARHLSRLGVHVNAMALGHTVVDNQPADVRAVTERPIRPALGGILCGYPTTYHKFSPLAAHGPRVAVTMFESDRIPPEWVPALNECHAVIVPSTFCRDTFRDCGVETPITVAPLGIARTYRPAPRSHEGPFTFLAFMDRGRRKGWPFAIQAFLRAFGDDTDYRLLLKAREMDVQQEITNPNIEALQADLTEAELCELYRSVHVLVNPNMGEGFGLIPREFAATGGVALATDWGGTADDLPLWGWPIPYRLTRAWQGHDRFAGLGRWAEPDVDALARLMRRVARERRSYLQAAAEKARAVRELYRWPAFASTVYDVWREVAHGHNKAERPPERGHRRRRVQPA